MMRPRVLLHSMTYKRDLPWIYVLTGLLEKLGCKCIITHNGNYVSRWARSFNPHGVFFVTPGRINLFKKYYPDSKFFICTGEAGNGDDNIPEKILLEERDCHENIGKIFLWGQHIFNTLSNMLIEKKREGFIQDNFMEKFVLCGNPHSDLINFNQRKNQLDSKIKIGFIGNFYYVNNIAVKSMFEHFGNKDMDDKVLFLKSNEIAFQYRNLKTITKLVSVLDKNRYAFSLRPYPLENRETYKQLKSVIDGSLHIDDSLCFANWLCEQDIVIGNTSTSILQIYLAEKPYINLDILNKRELREYDKRMLHYLARGCPDSFDALLDHIHHYKKYIIKSNGLEDELKSFYHSTKGQFRSVIYEMAQEIISELTRSNLHKTYHPVLMGVLNRMHVVLHEFLMHSRRNKTDYSYFTSGQLSSAGKELKGIIHNIEKLSTENRKS